jgi:arylsulfatase A-like enzyme
LLDYLDTSGLRENTIVLYTSDQGFFLGDHGWFDKRFMYEESLRFPLIVRFPAEIAPGTVEDHMVLNVDFAPTFLDYAGIEIPSDMQGRTIRPLLQGQEPPDWRTSMYYRYYEEIGPPLGHNVNMHYGVRTDRHKLIYYNKLNEWELFDLQSDPYELVNVYSDPAYANVVDDLKTELDDLRTKLDDNDEPVWMMSVAGTSHSGKGAIIRLPIYLIFMGLLTIVGSLSFIWRCCPTGSPRKTNQEE